MRLRRWTIVIAGLAAGGLALAETAASQPRAAPEAIASPVRLPAPPIDYRDPATWICRPGATPGSGAGQADGTCTADLDAIAIDAAGTRTPAPYVPAADPRIDCFYIYPTVSGDRTMFSDMRFDRTETRAVHGQAARLGSVCRLFAPAYRQLTGAGLRWALGRSAGDGAAPAIDFDPPYRDVLAAWRAYLARDNRGRGVVLIGHSQGAILLKRLIAEEIDGRPAGKRLVGAYLAGNPDLTSGSFRTIVPCRAAGQTGCLVAWSSYREGAPGPRVFGGGDAGHPAICVNPAALAGGRGALKSYFPKPAFAPAGDPPYIETIGQLSAECVRDERGHVLRVRIEPGRHADLLEAALDRRAAAGPTWGLHAFDIALVQGNLIDLIGAQAAAWRR